MILVQNIGMFGYVPLEGLVLLPHFWSDYIFCRCKHKFSYNYRYKCGRECESNFYYLFRAELDKSYDPDILNNIVSFAVVKRFDNFSYSTIVHDVGLMSGYYHASPLITKRLFDLFNIIMNIADYFNFRRVSDFSTKGNDQLLCSSAWSCYVCVDPDISYTQETPIYIRVIKVKNPIPDFGREDFHLGGNES
jgi:hypothetical protein